MKTAQITHHTFLGTAPIKITRHSALKFDYFSDFPGNQIDIKNFRLKVGTLIQVLAAVCVETIVLSKHLGPGLGVWGSVWIENRVGSVSHNHSTKGAENSGLKSQLQFLHRFNESKVLQMKVKSEKLLLNHQP